MKTSSLLHPAALLTIALLACTGGAQAQASRKTAKPAELPPLTESQIATAQNVLTGEIDCEGGKKLSLNAIDGKPGYFAMKLGKQSWTLAPQDTTTGAVRLEDKKAGMVWIQIPAKSMLMNAKKGQREVDNCTAAAQRTTS
ncbi:MAG: hypothetical protein RLY78_750 [Pseudomonadota bacterium]|jgi:hypothetical protein